MIRRRDILLLLMVIILPLVSSCRPPDVVIDSMEKKLFLNEDIVGYYIDGNPYFLYNENIHQISYNVKRNQVRIQTDNQTNYLNIVMQTKPKTEGVNVVTEVDYSFFGVNEKLIVLFECSKISDESLWLWDSDSKRGIIIKKEVIR